MKKRLNIFALLILMALSIHTGYTLFYSWGEISTAYKEGYEKAGKLPRQPNLSDLSRHDICIRKKLGSTAIIDSIYNIKTNSYIPTDIQKIQISIPDNQSVGYQVSIAIMVLLLVSGCNSRDCPFFEVDWCDTICFAIYENKRVTFEMDWWMSVVDCCYIYDRQLYGTGICPLCSRNIRL